MNTVGGVVVYVTFYVYEANYQLIRILFLLRNVRIVDHCFYYFCVIQFGSSMVYAILCTSLITKVKYLSE